MSELDRPLVSLQDVEEARRKLVGVAHHTDLLTSRTFSHIAGCSVHLKAENMQRTGSFKIRGAFNKMASLNAAERRLGVIAASAGNHAQGVAVAARMAGIAATVVMPESAALAKITATREYGAQVILHGQTYDEAFQHALSLWRDRQSIFVHPFDDDKVIAGQGTVALEILDDLPDVDAILVPVGGGGLISGIAVAAKERRPSVQVFGVQAAGADSAYRSLRSGFAQCSPRVATIADGIAVRCCGERALSHIRHFVDDIVLVEDEDISQTIVMLLERAKLVVEGAGAVALAALTAQRLALPGKKVAVVLSGGNVDINLLARLIEHGLTNAGRYLMLRLCLVDQPGQLHRLTGVLAGLHVNILDIQHRRTGVRVPVNQAEVELTLETRDARHGEQIVGELERLGYAVTRWEPARRGGGA